MYMVLANPIYIHTEHDEKHGISPANKHRAYIYRLCVHIDFCKIYVWFWPVPLGTCVELTMSIHVRRASFIVRMVVPLRKYLKHLKV
jgi:hypothetical protein